MFLVKLWDRNDKELLFDFHKKVILSLPTLTSQVNSVFKHNLKTILKTFLNERKEWERDNRK